MKKVLGLGNALLDIIYRIDDDSIINQFNLPRGGMQLVERAVIDDIISALAGKTPQEAAGGSASNTIHGIAGLKGKASFIGKIQNDKYGKILESSIKDAGIKPHLLYGKDETGIALTLVTPDSERTFAVYLGAALELLPEDLSQEQFEGNDILHIEGYLVQNHDLMLRAFELAKANNMQVSLDLASYDVVRADLAFLKEIAKNYVDIIFANEEEAKAFTGKSPEESLHEIAQLCEIAIVKTGAEGSMIKSGQNSCFIPARKVKPIDTTGAGDLYAGGFLFALTQACPIETCGKLGTLMASKVIETIGAKLTEAQWKDINAEWESMKK